MKTTQFLRILALTLSATAIVNAQQPSNSTTSTAKQAQASSQANSDDRTALASQKTGGNSGQAAGVNSPGPQQVQSLLGVKVVSPGATPNFIPVWTGAKIIGESVMTQNGSTIGVAGDVVTTGKVVAGGNVTTTGNVGIGTNAPAVNLEVFSSTPGVHAPMARFGSNGGNDANSILTYTGSGIAEMFQSGCVNCFMPGVQIGDGGLRVSKGKNIFFGDSGTARLRLDSAGNASQPRTANGMVKAMMFFSPFNGGRIVSCFNSTLSGAAATTPPCGFAFDITGVGDYLFVFGFQVDDRILSLTAGTTGASLSLSACNDIIGTCGHVANNQQVEVFSFISETDAFVDSKLYLVVY